MVRPLVMTFALSSPREVIVLSLRHVLAGGVVVVLGSAVSAQLLPTNENGVRSTLRGIASGQLTYSAVCASGFFAPSLDALARPEPGRKVGFILRSDVPPKDAKVLEKWHYRIEMTAPPDPKSPASCNGVPPGGSAKTWSATARPMPGYRGKSYRIDAEGELTEIK